MPTPEQTRFATQLVSTAAQREVEVLVRAMVRPDQGRHLAFSTIPGVIEHYGSGAAALAVDAFDERRAQVGAAGRYAARPFILGSKSKLDRAIAWATEPLYVPDAFRDAVQRELTSRLTTVTANGVADAGRNTTIGNIHADDQAVGWKRITGGHGCPFCRMLASRGAVYRDETSARFGAHDNCDCSAQAVFQGEVVKELNAIEFMASRRSRSRAQKDELNAYLRRNWSDENADLYD
jgi:hypothetical protein